MEKQKENVGKAYAFFDTGVSKREIEAKLPSIREYVRTPKELELLLTELTKNTRASPFSEPELCSIIRDAREAGMRYVMEASYSDGTNLQAADELANILNYPLFNQEQEFRGSIFYEERGSYVSRN